MRHYQIFANPIIIGFQIANNARNFLLDCRLSLPGVQVNPSNGVVYYRGRAVRVRVYPISVDVQALREDAVSLPALTYLGRRAIGPRWGCGRRRPCHVSRYQALCMPQAERRRRASLLRNTIEKEDLTQWLFRQLGDMAALDAETRAVSGRVLTTC